MSSYDGRKKHMEKVFQRLTEHRVCLIGGWDKEIKESIMTTTFLGVSYWELLDTLNTERRARKRSLSGEKLSYFEHAEFKGLVGHPQTDVQ